MNENILHILNGEGTWYSFRDAGIPGTSLIWHEALCQGPAAFHPTLEEFLAIRIPFLTDQFEAEPEPHFSRFKDEWNKWEDLSPYSELVLWFEYDLFCQANLLFLCHYLHHHSAPDLKISLVSPADHPEVPHFRGMGQLQPYQLARLFPERITLRRTDLEFADQVWRAWSNQDLKEVLKLSQTAPTNWPHLQKAVLAMLEELPGLDDALSATETLILSFLEGGPKSPGELFQHFLTNRDILGYGDLQFFQVVEGLIPVFIQFKDDHYSLNSLGEDLGNAGGDPATNVVPAKVLSQASPLARIDRWVGPVHINNSEFGLRWDKVAQKIVSSG